MRKRVWFSIWVRPAGVSTSRLPSSTICKGWDMLILASLMSSSGKPWTVETQEATSSRDIQSSFMAVLQGHKEEQEPLSGQVAGHHVIIPSPVPSLPSQFMYGEPGLSMAHCLPSGTHSLAGHWKRDKVLA